jgi:hypothetical protein
MGGCVEDCIQKVHQSRRVDFGASIDELRQAVHSSADCSFFLRPSPRVMPQTTHRDNRNTQESQGMLRRHRHVEADGAVRMALDESLRIRRVDTGVIEYLTYGFDEPVHSGQIEGHGTWQVLSQVGTDKTFRTRAC